ncbi:HAD family hydrolase [Winogradskyella bathintestinalis]|uniref:HAD family phosphatase n=1 Tax=Winogradskyella bathintestinalis TaxID=3035208 RepID=A0ABT7ZYF8_9FLAO|nr:HAD family phosphatase [Winogradskyella bathintestinalis]MDN3494024.1 HAD family phosphatase [Winogradskyella bathintestinalis]
MIKTLIFDFGDVFINLDKQGAMQNALNLFQLETFAADMIATNEQYEIGKISTTEFLEFYSKKFPYLKNNTIIEAWNYIIKDFPIHRLEFIKNLAAQNKYQLILLSNTNHMHIAFIKENVSFFEEFKSYFDVFYLSQELNLRKPNKTIFEYLLNENNLLPSECLFIDDTKENTDTAEAMGFYAWNIDETIEDVITLFETKKELF